jgi:hypothetical protein
LVSNKNGEKIFNEAQEKRKSLDFSQKTIWLVDSTYISDSSFNPLLMVLPRQKELIWVLREGLEASS